VIWNEKDGVIVADWDADGAVSAAILVYLQRNRLFPIKDKLDIHLLPAGAREVTSVIRGFNGCPRFVALLDIPYTNGLEKVLKNTKNVCKETKILYVDHHLSTLEVAGKLKEIIDLVKVGREKPTSLHLVQLAEKEGWKIPSRLKAFAEATGYIELGRKPPARISKIVELVASISRALKLEHDKSFWEKMINWMSNPLPIPLSKSEFQILERVKQEAQAKDEELEDAVTRLSVSAEKIGCFRFIDARKRWKRRGVTSLATRLSRKLKSPVALLAILGEGEILVIRTRNTAAKIIGDTLVEEKLGIDVGGHGNLAVVKLVKNPDYAKIKKILLHACRYTE